MVKIPLAEIANATCKNCKCHLQKLQIQLAKSETHCKIWGKSHLQKLQMPLAKIANATCDRAFLVFHFWWVWCSTFGGFGVPHLGFLVFLFYRFWCSTFPVFGAKQHLNWGVWGCSTFGGFGVPR